MTDYEVLARHYESCFLEHGDSHKGVDWPDLEDAKKRYTVMLGLMNQYLGNDVVVKLLDIGCGSGHLLEYIRGSNLYNIMYTGQDISRIFIQHCNEKFPGINFIDGDILSNDFKFPDFDFAIMNGVFTEKRELSFESMVQFFERMIFKIYVNSRKGIAFNVMSKNVDWERDDLFHLSLDKLTQFLTKKVSRNYVIRNDYGLYEYTVYVYK